MPPFRRTAASNLPTLLSLTKLVHLIPKRSSEWTIQGATLLSKAPPIDPEDPPDSPAFWWKLGLSVVFVLSGGVFAGLTLALMGSDDLNLRVLSASSTDPKERKAANKVLRLLGRGRHWVLVVLLLSNVIVNESLPIFLDDVLGGGLYAVIVSTTMIVIFGEIIPQAICVRYGLAIGGACAPLVWFFMILFSPIAWPTAKLLDYVLGTDEGHTYKKAELKSFLQFHREGEEPLRDDEIAILNGVLSLNDKHAQEIMTPIKDCLILPADKVLDHDAIGQILLSGFSRIPVHEIGQKDNFIGMLLVKRLITYNPDDEWPVSKFSLLPLPEAKPEINCFQALDYFQTGRAHLLLISETPGQKGGALGIVSLEDLIEEIIGEEIVDETDRYEDNHSKKIVKRSGPAAVMRGIIERRRVINAFSRRPSGEQRSNTHQLPQGNGTASTAGHNTTDGILVQIDNGNLIAEPVGFSGEGGDSGKDNVTVDASKRLVIGTDIESLSFPAAEDNGAAADDKQTGVAPMSTIEETSPVETATAAEVTDNGAVEVTTEEPVEVVVTAEEDDQGEAEAEGEGEGEGSGSGSGSGSGTASGTITPQDREDAPLLKAEQEGANGSSGDTPASANTNGNGGESKSKKKNKKKKAKKEKEKEKEKDRTPMPSAVRRESTTSGDLNSPAPAAELDQTNEAAPDLLEGWINLECPYESYGEFQRASKAFVAKYAEPISVAPDIESQTDAGGYPVGGLGQEVDAGWSGSSGSGSGSGSGNGSREIRVRQGQGQTNIGWEWKEPRNAPHQGYLYRRVTRYLPVDSNIIEPTPTSHGGESTADLKGAEDPAVEVDEGSELDHDYDDEEELMEEEEDEAAAPHFPASSTASGGVVAPQFVTDARGGVAQVGVRTEIQVQAKAQVRRVEIEQHIIYDTEAGCANFCFRAWDETGAPLPIADLLRLSFLRSTSLSSPGPRTSFPSASTADSASASTTASAPASASAPVSSSNATAPLLQSKSTHRRWTTLSTSDPDSMNSKADDNPLDRLMLDPSSPYPLIQSTLHPSTQQLMLGLHQLRTRDAIQAVLEPQLPEMRRAAAHRVTHIQNDDDSDSRRERAREPKVNQDMKTANRQESLTEPVLWLEVFMMLVNRVVDLTYP